MFVGIKCPTMLFNLCVSVKETVKAKVKTNFLENASFKKLVPFSANTHRKIVVPILVSISALQ